MNFPTKLEALKWMCENPLRDVYVWEQEGIHSFRNTENPEPEAKEIDIDWDDIALEWRALSPFDALKRYHQQLMPQLMKLVGRE